MGSLLILVLAVLQGDISPPTSPSEQPGPPPLASDIFPPGVSTEADYAQTLVTEDATLQRSVEQADAATRPGWQAHHAAWLLSVRCEPPLTRLVLGIGDDTDLTLLGDLGPRALKLAEQAQASWPQDDVVGREQLDLLINVARASSLLADARRASPNPQNMVRAADELAVWVDDDNPEIASAALLWSSLLYQESGQTDRALRLLPMVLEPVEGQVRDFYLRLLRCTLLARKGHTTLALALLLKMEERCPRWLPGSSLQQSALCTISWLRAQIAVHSTTELGEVARQTMQDWLQRAREVYRNPDAPCSLLRLRSTTPILFARPTASRVSQPKG